MTRRYMNAQTIIELLSQNETYIPLDGKKSLNNFTYREKSKLEIDAYTLEHKDKIRGMGRQLHENEIILDFDRKFDDKTNEFKDSVKDFSYFIDLCKKHTKVIHSGSGGYHIYFQCNERPIILKNDLPDNVEVKIGKKDTYIDRKSVV